jgi:hypothetical protein
VLAVLVIANSPRLGAQAGIQGQWTTLPYLMPIVAATSGGQVYAMPTALTIQ